MSAFPHLLVASEFPPNASGGGPAVVRQMLKEWPVEKLSWWSCFPERNAHFGQRVAAHRVAEIPPRLYPQKRFARQKSWLLETFWRRRAAPHFRETLQNLQPEAVWVIPHSWAVPPLADVLPDGATGYHVTVQDYVDTRTRTEQFGEARARRMAARADKLYSRATTRDATSHPMIADLRQRTGADAAQMLHAGLEEADFAWLTNRPEHQPGEIKIAYAGTIIAEDAFALFVRALAGIRSQLPAPVSLEFFGNDRPATRPWFDSSWMRERGNLPAPTLTQALRECAWGFSPMLLDNRDPRGNRFSFPTKFISYLAAGLPVITLGEPESTVVKMAKSYGVGLCTSERDAEKLGAELLAALSDPNPGAKFKAGIHRCATTEFDARRMRVVLYECFQTCARFTRKSRL